MAHGLIFTNCKILLLHSHDYLQFDFNQFPDDFAFADDTVFIQDPVNFHFIENATAGAPLAVIGEDMIYLFKLGSLLFYPQKEFVVGRQTVTCIEKAKFIMRLS